MAVKLGKREATYDKRDLRYAALRPVTLPAIRKPGGGYGMDFGSDRWLMLGNGPDDTVYQGFQGCGDCAWAGPAHETMEANFNAKRSVPSFSGATVVKQYSDYSGFDPQTYDNDTGSYVRDVLKYRQQTGLADDQGNRHKIGTYISLEPGNPSDLWEALWLFEAVGIGIEFPDSAMDQFDAGQPWSVVAGARIEGGHYVPIVGHPTADIWTCVTWGRRQTLTSQFLSKYCDEAWGWIDAERYNALTGRTQQGFTDVDLEAYAAALAQRSPQAA